MIYPIIARCFWSMNKKRIRSFVIIVFACYDFLCRRINMKSFQLTVRSQNRKQCVFKTSCVRSLNNVLINIMQKPDIRLPRNKTVCSISFFYRLHLAKDIVSCLQGKLQILIFFFNFLFVAKVIYLRVYYTLSIKIVV